MSNVYTEGFALGCYFLLNIALVIISAIIDFIDPVNRNKIFNRIAVWHCILFIILVISFSFLVGIGWINAFIVTAILIIGNVVPTKIMYSIVDYLYNNIPNFQKSTNLKRSKKSLENSIGYFMYAIPLVIVGLMARSPIWFLAASIFMTSGIVNAFFELTMKESIYHFLQEDETKLWTEYFLRHEWPLVFMLSSILIVYPLSTGMLDTNRINLIYDSLVTISTVAIGAAITMIATHRLETREEKQVLARLAGSFFGLWIVLMIIYLLALVYTHGELHLQSNMLSIYVPIEQRSHLSWKDILNTDLLGIAITLFIGILLYTQFIISLTIRMPSITKD